MKRFWDLPKILAVSLTLIVLTLDICHAEVHYSENGPDPRLTPGKALYGVGVEQICKPGYAGSVRNVPESEKEKVYAEYEIQNHTAGQYEVDHCVSLELGGSNDIENLWPQSYTGLWNAHLKDRLENWLHKEVCKGNIPLDVAQHEICAGGWMASYKKYSLDKQGNGGFVERNVQ